MLTLQRRIAREQLLQSWISKRLGFNFEVQNLVEIDVKHFQIADQISLNMRSDHRSMAGGSCHLCAALGLAVRGDPTLSVY